MKIFKLPDLGEGLQEADIVAWHVSPGDHVVAGQPLVSVETAKAIVEVPTPYAGRVEKLFADNQLRLGMTWLAGRDGGNRVLTGEAELKPTIGQVGHMNFIHPFRIQILGAAEIAHLGSLGREELERLIDRLFTTELGSEYLRAIGVEFGGYMAAVLALMETPAILAAILIAGSREGTAEARFKRTLWREVFLNGADVVLIGSFVIGAITGERGMERLDMFVGALFQGALCLFLLDMGLVASRRIAEAPKLNWRLIGFAMGWPLISAAIALAASAALGLSLGDASLMAILAASASYIAAPAAMRIALPKADAGVYLSLSLGVTFPFNLLVGIPLYHAAARLMYGRCVMNVITRTKLEIFVEAWGGIFLGAIFRLLELEMPIILARFGK